MHSALGSFFVAGGLFTVEQLFDAGGLFDAKGNTLGKRMMWTWEFRNANGSRVLPVLVAEGQSFPSQSDAENWLGEEWRVLAEAGVAAVILREAGREVYGPMALAAK